VLFGRKMVKVVDREMKGQGISQLKKDGPGNSKKGVGSFVVLHNL
jgi:hypothetical protein